MIALWLAAACQEGPLRIETGPLNIALSDVELDFRPEVSGYVVRASALSSSTVVRVTGDRVDRVALRTLSNTGAVLEDVEAFEWAVTEDTRLEIEVFEGASVGTWTLAFVPEGLPLLQASGEDPGLHFFLTPRDYSAAYPPSGLDAYLLVVNGLGLPLWWRRTRGVAYDFRPAADGSYTALARLDGAANLEAVRLAPIGGQTTDRWLPVGPSDWDTVFTDPHELRVAEDGSWLQSIAGTGTLDLSAIGGAPEGAVQHSGFVEHDAAGEVVALWSTEDVVDLTLLPPDVLAAETLSGAWRYGHVNSVDMAADAWLVSLRSPGEVLRIRREDGGIDWTLGGPRSDFVFVDDPRDGFFGQHSARFVSPDRVMVFDNGTNMGSDALGDARVVSYALDEEGGTATLVFSFELEGAGGAEFAGSVQPLPDGRTVVGFGSVQQREDGSRAPTVGVLGSDGRLESELALPEGMYSYRIWAQ